MEGVWWRIEGVWWGSSQVSVVVASHASSHCLAGGVVWVVLLLLLLRSLWITTCLLEEDKGERGGEGG